MHFFPLFLLYYLVRFALLFFADFHLLAHYLILFLLLQFFPILVHYIIDDYGCDDGISVINLEDILTVSVDTDDEQDALLLYKANQTN